MFTAAPKSAPLPRKQYGGGGRRIGGQSGGGHGYDVATLTRTKSTAKSGGFSGGGGGGVKYQFVKRKPLFAAEGDENRRYTVLAKNGSNFW